MVFHPCALAPLTAITRGAPELQIHPSDVLCTLLTLLSTIPQMNDPDFQTLNQTLAPKSSKLTALSTVTRAVIRRVQDRIPSNCGLMVNIRSQ